MADLHISHVTELEFKLAILGAAVSHISGCAMESGTVKKYNCTCIMLSGVCGQCEIVNSHKLTHNFAYNCHHENTPI